MNNTRALLASFLGACTLLVALVWWYRPASFQAIALFLGAWVIIGLGSAAVELATLPTDASVPRRYRLAGKVFRSVVATTGFVLIAVALLGVWGHAS